MKIATIKHIAILNMVHFTITKPNMIDPKFIAFLLHFLGYTVDSTKVLLDLLSVLQVYSRVDKNSSCSFKPGPQPK